MTAAIAWLTELAAVPPGTAITRLMPFLTPRWLIMMFPVAVQAYTISHAVGRAPALRILLLVRVRAPNMVSEFGPGLPPIASSIAAGSTTIRAQRLTALVANASIVLLANWTLKFRFSLGSSNTTPTATELGTLAMSWAMFAVSGCCVCSFSIVG